MARNAPARRAKTAGTNTSKPAPPPPSSSSPASSTPSPFVPADPALVDNFLSTLPKFHVYLTSIDTTPPTLKQRAFLVPTALNVLIVLGLCYRIYTAFPTYLALIITVFGYDSVATVNTADTTILDLAAITSQRTFFIFFDYALFAILGSWPYEFLFGSKASRHVGPVAWRRTVPFQEKEIIVRRSRKWANALFHPPSRTLTLDDEVTLKLKITPAMSKSFLSKTGYAMLDKNWDLDFAGMATAHSALSASALPLSAFTDAAFLYSHSQNKWLTWSVHPPNTYQPSTAEDQTTLDHFRTKLEGLGHEDLFYRYVELLQYESSSPGGFTPGRQAAVMRQAKRMFEEKGVDFAKFWEEVGGREGMPGLDG